jgi:hypothetical protein
MIASGKPFIKTYTKPIYFDINLVYTLCIELLFSFIDYDHILFELILIHDFLLNLSSAPIILSLVLPVLLNNVYNKVVVLRILGKHW